MTPSLVPELNPDDQIRFLDSHRVSLLAGDYTINAIQTVSGSSHSSPAFFDTFDQAAEFAVAGERLALDPQQIHSVFPPAGSRGDFSNDLPHIILERSTLPWERSAVDSRDVSPLPPWLALLVFHQSDPIPAPQTVRYGDVHDTSFPFLTPESGQRDDDRLTVIDVPSALLRSLLGPAFSPAFQTHARHRLAFCPVAAAGVATINRIDLSVVSAETDVVQSVVDAFAAVGVSLSPHSTIQAITEDTDGLPIRGLVNRALFQVRKRVAALFMAQSAKYAGRWSVRDLANHETYEVWKRTMPADGGRLYDLYRVAHETAVVLANRLPQAGGRNVVHLVSIENRLLPDGTAFNFQPVRDDQTIRLISLHSWEIFCQEPSKSFSGLLTNLNGRMTTPVTFALPVATAAEGQTSGKMLQAGLVPLRHRFREGSRSVSWYHGPLVPNEPSDAAQGTTLPADSADHLLIYDQTTQMFDASYAAAWELGRMLTLANGKVALSLYQWKRNNARSLNAGRALADYGYELPAGTTDTAGTPGELPDDVGHWLNELTLLVHVPFPYLVPDAGLLPIESLRFFEVDRVWLECLRDGAFSIGRVLPADTANDKTRFNTFKGAKTIPVLSGLLLRSEVVSGWPGLRCEGFDAVPAAGREQDPMDVDPLPLLRMERLAPGVLLCLFEGSLKTVNIHVRPETLHFGFDRIDATHSFKTLRDGTGDEVGAAVPFDAPDDKRIVSLAKLASAMEPKVQQLGNSPLPENKKMNAAVFALEMIAGVPLVRFIRT